MEDQSLMTNSDNYVYSNTHCYGILLQLPAGHSKKILDLLIHQVSMYKIVLVFCRLRLIPVQELCVKDNIEPIVIIDE